MPWPVRFGLGKQMADSVTRKYIPTLITILVTGGVGNKNDNPKRNG